MPGRLNGERLERLDALTTRARKMRGQFVELALSVETLLAGTIAEHLCPDLDRSMFLFSVVLGDPEVSFGTKIRLYTTMLQGFYPDIWEAHPGLGHDLNEVRDFRNRLAQSLLDTSEESLSRPLPDAIPLVTYKDGRKNTDIVEVAFYEGRVALANSLIKSLQDIRAQVEERTGQE